MLLQLSRILQPDAVQAIRARLTGASWGEGAATAGHQSARVKQCTQLAEGDPLARSLGEEIAAALARAPLFVSAALPSVIHPPLLSRYRPGEGFGLHVDNAVRYGPQGRMRADLSATLFLSDPDSYEGGELVIEDQFGSRALRLPAGDLVLYPSSSLHRVTPILSGERLAAVLWIQSLVRDDGQRRLLFELDGQIQALATDLPDDQRVLALTGIYHNLVRRWAAF